MTTRLSYKFTLYQLFLLLLVIFICCAIWVYRGAMSTTSERPIKGALTTCQNVTIAEKSLFKLLSTFNHSHTNLLNDTMLNLLNGHRPNNSVLGNMTNFQLLTDINVCDNDSDVFMLILIGSHAAHKSQRNVFRNTLGNPDYQNLNFKTVFTFGLLPDPNEQRHIEEEMEQYKDIIQGNFIDSYNNVSLRDLMALRWTWQRCSQAKYVMRIDDDTSVNIFKLVDMLNVCCSHKPMFIGCFEIWHNAEVYRDGRYGVNIKNHPKHTYEDYCFGWMYTLTPLMAFMLDLASQNVNFYWLNDAFITGDLVKWLGIQHTVLNMDFTFDTNQMRRLLENKADLDYALGPNDCDTNLSQALFDKFKTDYQHH